MDIEKIWAFVKADIPNATKADVRFSARKAMLHRINADGLQSKRNLTVITATGTYNSDPQQRTDDQGFNLYPDIRCLVMPSGLMSITAVSYEGVPLSESTDAQYLQDCMPDYSYNASPDGLMYLSFVPEDGKVFRFTGLFRGYTIENLPDNFEPWLVTAILADLSSSKFKDELIFKMNAKQEITLWNKTGSGISGSPYANFKG